MVSFNSVYHDHLIDTSHAIAGTKYMPKIHEFSEEVKKNCLPLFLLATTCHLGISISASLEKIMGAHRSEHGKGSSKKSCSKGILELSRLPGMKRIFAMEY